MLTVLLCLVGLSVYLGWVINSAREYTLDTILPAYRDAQYPLAVSDLSPRQLEILLKVEDPNFFGHEGVDFSTPGAGITTITQALVKHLYFEKFTPGFGKLKQTAIARYVLDPLMDKHDQLQLFINTAYLSPTTIGFSQAAHVYFGKSFAQLNDDEYIALVAMLIGTPRFDK